jgi:hypothetical protein
MKAAELRALEKVWEAEISDRLPFQSKAKVYKDLSAAGHLEIVHRRFGNGGDRFAVTVEGYSLTHLGRWTYCASCPDGPTDPSPPPDIAA